MSDNELVKRLRKRAAETEKMEAVVIDLGDDDSTPTKAEDTLVGQAADLIESLQSKVTANEKALAILTDSLRESDKTIESLKARVNEQRKEFVIVEQKYFKLQAEGEDR